MNQPPDGFIDLVEPLAVFPAEAAEIGSEGWTPKLQTSDYILRYTDTFSAMANCAGLALTHTLRFYILSIGWVGLLLAEVATRIDIAIIRQMRKMEAR